MEIWKDVIGYEGTYQVSNIGRVKRIDKTSKKLINGCFLKLSETSKGYFAVKLLSKRLYVHKLVAMAFIGKVPKNKEINHKDCDKKNNCVNNLEYVTHLENVRHALKNGLRPSCKKENNPFYGKKHNEKSIKKMRNKVFSEETRLKMSKSAKIRAKKEGNTKTKLMWKAKRGSTLSFESLEKCRIAQQNRTFYPKWTPERKKMMSERMKGKNNPFYGKKHNEKVKKIISQTQKIRHSK